MAESLERAEQLLRQLLTQKELTSWNEQLTPDTTNLPEYRSDGLQQSSAAIKDLLTSVTSSEEAQRALGSDSDLSPYLNTIENMVGTIQIPVGIAGPLRLRGTYAQGDFKVPLATHEAALVASYHRGMRAVTEAGGATALLLNEGVPRVPCFTFSSTRDAANFLAWLIPREETLRQTAEATTRHGKLSELRLTVEGCHVYLHCHYTTGDAAGQNMVTLATQAICDSIAQESPIPPKAVYVESNLSGDKKASAISFGGVRGKKVTCEVLLPAEVLKRRLKVSAAQMEDYWRVSAIGGVLSGSVGIQGHYANGLAALFIACGQDAACVAEAAVGVTRFEKREEDALYACVTLPNLIVGTVGGGTHLPSQQACLNILGLAGEGKARAFAEVCAGVALAGELSIIAAIATNRFTKAHEILARLRRRHTP
ncbi:MAG: hydroxymethylglutaryl-CoA reductase [Opitutales bacterium]|nr:hydroxymethylglutaryl-CoA reductase [Opitutales bacterium]MCH8540451.1 hydroxymethylglutaryl-CoA reductase [Opitutales bacterium]